MSDSEVEGDDRELIRRAQAGDRSALESLLRRCWGPLWRFIVGRICCSHDEADEIMGETMLRACANIDAFSGDSAVSTWLSGIAKHVHQERQRKARARVIEVRLETLPDTYEQAADEQVTSTIEPSELTEMIESIDNPGQRQCLQMRRDGLSYRDIGGELGMPVNTAKSLVHRGIRHLKDMVYQREVAVAIASPETTRK